MRTYKNKQGSALIMAIAVVTMLAIVGAMFLLMSRIEEGSTSSLEEFKSLDAAADSVIATIAMELKLDTPGVDANNTDYYDYPGTNDKWLANLEPYKDGGVYKWMQISDIFSDFNDVQRQNIALNGSGLFKAIIAESKKIEIDSSGNLLEQFADADGDGVADSKWVKLDNISSSTGRPIYAAIRVIDNGGMLNVNTAYKFDPDSTKAADISGRYLRNIDLMALSERNAQKDSVDQKALLDARNIAESNLPSYEAYAAYDFENNFGSSTPFDIGDELRLKYRYVLDYNIGTRIENMWDACYEDGISTPVETTAELNEWCLRACYDTSDPNGEGTYDYRHISTTYNVDRTIDPNGDAMFYIEDANNPQALYDKIKGLARNTTQREEFAQLAANIVDYGDNDCNVTYFKETASGDEYYGFDKPYIYISEIARLFVFDDANTPPDYNNIKREYAIELHNWYNKDDEFNTALNNDYRFRIVNPSGQDITIDINDQSFKDRGGRFFVKIFRNDFFLTDANDLKSEYTDLPWDGAEGVDPDVVFGWGPLIYPEDVDWAEYQFYIGGDEQDVENANSKNHPGVIYEKIDTLDANWPYVDYDPNLSPDTKYYWKIKDVDVNGVITDANGRPVDANAVVVESPVYEFTTWESEPNDYQAWDSNSPLFYADSQITLERKVPDGDGGYKYITVDTFDTNTTAYKDLIYDSNSDLGKTVGICSIKRELNWGLILKNEWSALHYLDSLGNSGGHYFSTDKNFIPPHNWSGNFANVGEAGLLFRVDAYTYPFVNTTEEKDVRIDLADPNFQMIFQYITRMESSDSYDRIKGRININTAPWYVLAQLPWVSQRRGADNLDNNELAKAIVDFRDRAGNYSTDRYTAVNSEYGYLGLSSTDIREESGFASIGELNYIVAGSSNKENIAYYALDNKDQPGFPDLSYYERELIDGSPDDFEERNLIFARISDLVTVRSDVFTAYVLVRLGEDGPQRRIIVILDRSEVGTSDDKVKVHVKYPVPDPR